MAPGPISRRLTTGVGVCFLRLVRLIRNIVVILLVALWLPTTQHCALEAAGLFSSQEEVPANQTKCCGEPGKTCVEDPCNLLESGDYTSATAQPAVPVPAFTVCHCLLCISVAQDLISTDPDAATACVSFDRPAHCSPTWHFMQRAALSPRAPSLFVA